MHTGFWWVHQKEGNHLEDLDVVGRIILKWALKKQNGIVRTEFLSWYGPVACCCQHCIGPMGSIK
jgi:hypothetical protein